MPNSEEARDRRLEAVEHAFHRNAEATPGRVWTDVIHVLRRHALQSNLSPDQYRDLLLRACKVLQGLGRVTGRLREDSWTGKVIALDRFWNHASTRELFGFDPLELNTNGLASAFAAYLEVPMQTPYLDWVFLDAYLYHVYFICQRDYDEDRLGPQDYAGGTFLPRVQRMVARSSDAARAHPLLLEFGMTMMRGALKLAPTVIVVTIGLVLLFFDWEKTGSAVLVAWLLYRIARMLRWMLRAPLRRRVRRFLEKLLSAYELLEGAVIPTRQYRRTVHEALQISGERLMFGVEFWAVLDHVCEEYPAVLNRGSA